MEEISQLKMRTFSLTKRHNPIICCLQETHFRDPERKRVEKNVFGANGNYKWEGRLIPTSDIIYTKTNAV